MGKSRKIYKLYGIIESESIKNGMTVTQAAEEAIKGGVTIIRLTERNRSEEEILDMAVELKAVCHKYGVPLVINDHPHIAYKCGADGVHLSLEDSDFIYARRILGKDAIIGATAHSLLEAQAALVAGVDYLGCGAVFKAPDSDAVGISLEHLKEICGKIDIPVIAVGGINGENIMKLRNCGTSGVAVMSSVFCREDIKTAAVFMRNLADSL